MAQVYAQSVDQSVFIDQYSLPRYRCRHSQARGLSTKQVAGLHLMWLHDTRALILQLCDLPVLVLAALLLEGFLFHNACLIAYARRKNAAFYTSQMQ